MEETKPAGWSLTWEMWGWAGPPKVTLPTRSRMSLPSL